jgi:hypothetical protein
MIVHVFLVEMSAIWALKLTSNFFFDDLKKKEKITIFLAESLKGVPASNVHISKPDQ